MRYHSSVLMTMIIAMVVSSSATADITRGQKWYTKDCKSCHGNGTKGAGMHTQDEWNDLFSNESSEIIKKHIGTPAEAYFKGENFKNRAQDVRDFLFEYGSDSGNVPAC